MEKPDADSPWSFLVSLHSFPVSEVDFQKAYITGNVLCRYGPYVN